MLFLVVAVVGGNAWAQTQSNDNFVDRLPLTGSHPTAVSSNLHATREIGEPNHAGDSAGRSLWYTWTAPTTGTVNIGTYETNTNAPTMRALAVYTGSALGSLTEVASSNNFAQSEYQQYYYYPNTDLLAGTTINVPVTAGTTYQIAVDSLAQGWYPDDGTTVLAINALPVVVSAANATGTTGGSFSYAVTASGGPTAYTATGLPTGLVINATTGLISGTAVATGTYTIGLSATGPGGTGTATLTLRFSDPVAATPAAPVIMNDLSLVGYVGVALNTSVSTSGSPTAYAATNLPDGLTLNTSTGALTGTPTTAGVYTVPVSATNAVGMSTATLTINVTTPPLPIINSALAASGTTGSSFSYYIDTNLDGYTGIAPTAWTATNLPPGLSLSATSNYICGTPTQAGVYPAPVTVTSPAGTRQAVVTLTITDPPAATPATTSPVLTSRATAQGVVGSTFGYTLAATQLPTSFGASSLPAGITFNASAGVFAGTPTAAGTFLVPVTATNAFGTSNGTLTVTIFANAAAQGAANGVEKPAVVSAASKVGYVGQSLSYGITATLEGSPYFNVVSGAWTFSATGLPPGLSVTTSNGGTSGFGTISGTPTQAGTYQATITATTPTGYPQPYPYLYSYGNVLHPASTGTAVVTFLINSAGATVVAPVITGSATATAVVGTASTYYPAASSTVAYTLAASGLPPGMSYVAGSNYISGTPTAAGTYPATITATNSGGTGTATVTFIVADHGSAPLITSAATASGTVGNSFSYSIYSSGSASYGASSLPPGLSFSATSGVISGTPTQAGTYTVPISATNAAGTGSASLTLTIGPAGAIRPPAITSYAVAQGTIGQSFSYYFNTDVTATSYAVGGALPPGLSLTAGSSYISGTPTQAGTYTVPISATNAAGTGSATLTIIVTSPSLPVFSSQCALSATVGQSFYSSVSASNYPTSYTFSGLPAGITQNSPGYLSGTPTQAGVYTVPVSATNGSGTTSVTLTVTVAAATNSATAAPVLSALLGLNGSVGDPFSEYIGANTSNATITALSALPPGLSFNSSTNQLTGTPTQTGVYPVTFKASNTGGSSQGIVTVTVAAAAIQVPGIQSVPTIIALQKEPIYFPVSTYPLAASYTTSGLPSGVSIDTAKGIISGSVATPGTYPINVTATNSAGQGTATLMLTVVAPAFAVTTTPLSYSARVGQAFTATLTNSSNAASNSAATGLPPGLSINASTGVISGTPTTAGSYNATTTQTSEYGTVTGHVTFFIGTTAPTTPVFSSAGGVGGYVNTNFYYRLRAANSPTSFSVVNTLPDGLTYDSTTGVIWGTPSTAGTYALNTYAYNASGSGLYSTLVITIAPVATAPLQVTTSAGMWWTVNNPSLNYTVRANLPSFSVTGASNLPPGLSFSGGGITGTPTVAGRYDVTLALTNGYTGATSSAVINFRIDAADPTVPYFFCYATTNGAVGSAFSFTVTGIDSTPTVTASNLPPGLSFNAASSVISGTPTTAGTYQVPASTTNANGTRTGTLTVVIAPPPAPSLVSSSNGLERAFTVGTASSTASNWYINATGSPTSYAASGLPPGLTLNTATGQITGTLTTAGTYPVTVSATNATGTASAVITYVVSPVTLGPPVIPYLAANYRAFAGVPISTVSLSGSNSPTAYTASGLPPGLTLNTTSGQITGTPTTPGNYAVNLSATNAAGTGTAVWTVIVNDASVLSAVFSSVTAEFGGTVGQSSDHSFYAYAYYGSTSTNAAATLTVSGLPAGVQVYSSGANYLEITGTPTTAGTYPLTLTATVPGGASANATSVFVVVPAPAPTITSAAAALGNVNNAFSYYLSTSNTVTTYTAGTLPAGLILNASTGQITGTPTTVGTTAVSVSASGPYGTASGTITIRIDPPLYGGLPVISSAAAISSQDFVDETYPPYYYPFYPYTGPAVNYTLAALNGSATFRLTNLPAGLVFNPYNNTITGQPVATGVFQVPVTATNAAGSVSATLTIISAAPLATAAPPLAQSGYVGGSFNGTFPAYYPALGAYGTSYTYPYYYYYYGQNSQRANPVTFTAAGLPPGLSLNKDTGAVSGTFVQAGTYRVTMTASSLAGTGSAICTFTVAASGSSAIVTTAPTFSGAAQAAGFVGVPLNYYLYGTGASSYAATGLPAGLALNTATGQITGNPTATGTYPVTVSATNAAGTTQGTLTVTVDTTPPAPQLEGQCTATATVGTAFYYYIDAYGVYSGLPAATSYAASGLPAGLSLNATSGQITGTPTGPVGVYTVPVTAFVGPATSLGGVLTLTIQNPPPVTTLPVMTSAAGALGWSGNPFVYSIYNTAFVPDTGSLPPGLSYNATTGVIGGLPTTTGTYTVPLATTGTSNNTTPLTSTLTISVLAPDLSLPRLTTSPGSGVVMGGNSFTFTAAAVGAPAPTYQWRHNGVAVPGATGATLTLNTAQPADSGTYTVTAANTAGSVTSVPATLLVQTTFAQWQSANFTAQQIAAGLAADNATPSGDGVPNLLKYALGLDPSVPAGNPLLNATRTASGALQITFTRDAGETDINYAVEATGNLSAATTNGWTTVAEGDAGAAVTTVTVGTGVTEAAVSGTSRVRVTVQTFPPVGEGPLFLRLRIVRP